MTTIIGIVGRDPISCEDYVLLAADSRAVYGGLSIAPDFKKLFGSIIGNYVIGTTGKGLEKYFSKEREKELSELFRNPQMETRESLERKLMKADSVLRSELGHGNGYLTSITEENVQLYTLTEKGLKSTGPYSAIGYGMHFVTNLSRLSAFKENSRILLDKKTALAFALEAFNEVAGKTKTTGGYMDAGIVTQSGITMLPAFSKINPIIIPEHTIETLPTSGHPYLSYDDE